MEPIFSKQLLQQTEKFLNKNSVLKSLIEKLEKIYSEAKTNEDNARVLKKVEKLRNLLLDILKKEINDDAYQIAIALAERFPLNDRDPISLDVIPKEKLLITAYGRHFNIENILKFHEERDTRKDDEVGKPKLIIDPVTNKPFNENDIIYIKKSPLFKEIIVQPKAAASFEELLRVLSEIRESESTNNNNHHHGHDLPSNLPEGLLPLLMNLWFSHDTVQTLNPILLSILIGGPVLIIIPNNNSSTHNLHISSSNNNNNNFSFYSSHPIMSPQNMHHSFRQLANQIRIRNAIEETLMHAPNYIPYLKTLDKQILMEVCRQTSNAHPEISALVITDHDLRNRFSEDEQATIISQNSVIGYIIYTENYPENIIFPLLGAEALSAICSVTCIELPGIPLEIFSNDQLREKIAIDKQYEIIRNSHTFAKALYNKGFEFLQKLHPSCLIAICESTAKEKPQISVDIISHFSIQFSPSDRRKIFALNPQIETELKKREVNNNNLTSHSTTSETTTTTTTTNASPYFGLLLGIASALAASHLGAATYDYASRRKIEESIAKTKKLYQQHGDFLGYLLSIPEDIIGEICLETVEEYPEISIAALTNSTSRNRIDGSSQMYIIKNSFIVAKALYEKGETFLDTLSTYCLAQICKTTAKKRPDISVDIITKYEYLFDGIPYEEIISINPQIEVELKKRRTNNNNSTTSHNTMRETTTTTSTTSSFPVFTLDAGRISLSPSHTQSNNTKRKIDEAIAKTKKLYQQKGDFLSYLASVDEETLCVVCLKTAKEFPEISIAVLTSTLRNKIDDFSQSRIIKKSFAVAKTLYEKGVNFVNTLSTECLIAICYATAKERPDISIDIITNYNNLFDDISEYQDIININPKIEAELNKRRTNNNNNNNVFHFAPPLSVNDIPLGPLNTNAEIALAIVHFFFWNILNNPNRQSIENYGILLFYITFQLINHPITQISNSNSYNTNHLYATPLPLTYFRSFLENAYSGTALHNLEFAYSLLTGLFTLISANHTNNDLHNNETSLVPYQSQNRQTILYRPNIYSETMRIFARQEQQSLFYQYLLVLLLIQTAAQILYFDNSNNNVERDNSENGLVTYQSREVVLYRPNIYTKTIRFFASHNDRLNDSSELPFEYLSGEQLFNYCFAKKNFNPEISASVLINPVSRNKLTIEQQKNLILSNPKIAFSLVRKGTDFLLQFDGECLQAICLNTINYDDDIICKIISSDILSNESLSAKLPLDFQVKLIESNPQLALLLHIKGYPLLVSLHPKVLTAICKAAANTTPYISANILANSVLRERIDTESLDVIRNIINNNATAPHESSHMTFN